MKDFEKISQELRAAVELSQKETEKIMKNLRPDLFGYAKTSPETLFFDLRAAVSHASEAFSRAFERFSSMKAEDDAYIRASGVCAEACDEIIGEYLGFCSEKLLRESDAAQNILVSDIHTRAASTFAKLYLCIEKIR